MNPSLLRVSPKILTSKNFLRLISDRPYSDGNYKKNNPINKIAFVGGLGMATALFASYAFMKNKHKQEATDMKISKNIVPDPNTLFKNPVDLEEGNPKEDHLREQYNFIKKVVNDCAGAVFYLEIRDPSLKDPETGNSVVTSNGSGFIISEDGWALTNAHVVINKPQTIVTAVMRDGRSFNVKVEDADMNIDLALLKLETNEKLPSLQFGAVGDTAVGEWVVALGSPLSLSNSVTVGIVSSIDRPAEELGLKNYSMTYIQTDASITFGNSGGPLVNLDGDVIGINNLRLTSGISFAIPVEFVKKFLQNSKYRLVKSPGRKTSKPVFGLTTITITPDLLVELHKENENIPKELTHGLLVWKIIPGTPAQMSGLEVGDIITHVNGIPVQKPVELYNFTSSKNVVEIRIINRGKKKNVFLNVE
ncbi:unnamed protein product [Ceutorhynchus assimilis]|uniref:Serine protease HTRA2, mitochondrial n=1 Tax=Ceutorhynchus assimilis TaxID=467358 RepID=A0A9N9MVI0_9CUCU|nr:unnamed protein product [Ceutorhynchus assimilis]